MRPNQAQSQQTIHLADRIQRHLFPILATTIDAGPRSTGAATIARHRNRTVLLSPHPLSRHPARGDHKAIWELNRHQHLVVLAQAYLPDGRGRATWTKFARSSKAGWPATRFHRGTNWASALEVAFRAMSWIWVYHLVGCKLPGEFRARWLHMLYLHGCHLANNLSFYFSPNKPSGGRGAGFAPAGAVFRRLSKGRDLGKKRAARVMSEAMNRQIRADGSSFEQSTYYQGYLLDMFRLHAVLAAPGPEYLAKLERMAEYLDAVTGPSGLPPMLGDDDGGHLLYSYRPLQGAGRRQSRLFAMPASP